MQRLSRQLTEASPAPAEASPAPAVLAIVRERGHVRLDGPLTDATFVRMARELGEVIDDTPVRIVPGKRTYLASPAAIPLHTDYPTADFLAWRCESQDAIDGASVLVDGREVLGRLGEDVRAVLARTLLPAMIRLGDDPLPTPILSSTATDARIFYAPWLEPLGKPPEAREPLAALREAIRTATPYRQRLRPGAVLIIDNHRMLHGRDAVAPDSPRRLRRLWISRASRPA